MAAFTRPGGCGGAIGAVLGVTVAVCLAGWPAGCTNSPNSRCKQLCQRQIECIEQQDLKRQAIERPFIDEHECTSACTALDNDSEGKKLVDAHGSCVELAGEDCSAVLACE